MTSDLVFQTMRGLFVLLAGFFGTCTGYFGTAFVGFWLAGLAGMSDFEGGRGMFAGFILGPIGALIGLIAGAIVGWKLGNRPSTSRILLLSALCLAAAGVAWQLFLEG